MEKIIIDRPGKYDIQLQLDKDGKRMEWLGIMNARVRGEYELDLVINHKVPNTIGRVEVRGVAENGARVIIKGLVKITKEAQETDSFLSMKILLLDKKSSAVVEPELEIEANRVKASHAASVGKIDPEHIFYLASRGINEEEARHIIINGFLN